MPVVRGSIKNSWKIVKVYIYYIWFSNVFYGFLECLWTSQEPQHRFCRGPRAARARKPRTYSAHVEGGCRLFHVLHSGYSGLLKFDEIATSKETRTSATFGSVTPKGRNPNCRRDRNGLQSSKRLRESQGVVQRIGSIKPSIGADFNQLPTGTLQWCAFL
jgi:hypothetical protein